jgi:hypothetical protein
MRRLRFSEESATYVALVIAGCVNGAIGFTVLYVFASMVSM